MWMEGTNFHDACFQVRVSARCTKLTCSRTPPFFTSIHLTYVDVTTARRLCSKFSTSCQGCQKVLPVSFANKQYKNTNTK
jgi:hypothetical protein